MRKTVFIDMDDCISDLSLEMSNRFGHSIHSAPRENFVKGLIALTNDQGFARLELMPRALDIQKFVVDNQEYADFEILTSHGSFFHDPNVVANQKQIWLKRKLPVLFDLPFNIVESGRAKARFAFEGAILVDDMKDNVLGFIENFGDGYVYTPETHDLIFSEIQATINASKTKTPVKA